MPTKKLSEALHTYTTVPNVAKYLASQHTYNSVAELTRAALMIINPGYDYTLSELARIHRDRNPAWLARTMDVISTFITK